MLCKKNMGWEINVECTKCGRRCCLPNEDLSRETKECALEAIYCDLGGCDHLPAGSYGKQEKSFKITSMIHNES